MKKMYEEIAERKDVKFVKDKHLTLVAIPNVTRDELRRFVEEYNKNPKATFFTNVKPTTYYIEGDCIFEQKEVLTPIPKSKLLTKLKNLFKAHK